MMKHEFEALAGYEVTTEDYNNLIEPMYMAVNVTKQEFVKMIDKKRFALPTKGEMKRAMRRIAKTAFDACGIRSINDEDAELTRLARTYAKRFYGVDVGTTDIKNVIYFNRVTAYGGVEIECRGNTCPSELVIGYGDEFNFIEYERIALIG